MGFYPQEILKKPNTRLLNGDPILMQYLFEDIDKSKCSKNDDSNSN